MKRTLLILSIVIFAATLQSQVRVGAEQTEKYLPLLKGKKVALVINQTSTINGVPLLDTLLSAKIEVKTVFAPEHGFRGTADAGENIKDSKDRKTGIPLVSIYGKNKKPTPAQLTNIDVVVFDIQDVGARFYTYISTLHYVMEACAENNKQLIVLDRPNPNDYIDGPVLSNKKFRSFVGVDPIPLLHGCTVGELAEMINGQKWLEKGLKCKLWVIAVKGWKHKQPYSINIKPSPNLPNNQAIKLYPSLCLFEGTHVSVGRGTQYPFQVIGYPNKKFGKFHFTPEPIKGMDTNPLYKDSVCYGLDLRNDRTAGGLQLKYLIDFYHISGMNEKFFLPSLFFDKLAGTDELRKMIIAGKNEAQIRLTWQRDLSNYKKIRQKYLLYSESKP